MKYFILTAIVYVLLSPGVGEAAEYTYGKRTFKDEQALRTYLIDVIAALKAQQAQVKKGVMAQGSFQFSHDGLQFTYASPEHLAFNKKDEADTKNGGITYRASSIDFTREAGTVTLRSQADVKEEGTAREVLHEVKEEIEVKPGKTAGPLTGSLIEYKKHGYDFTELTITNTTTAEMFTAVSAEKVVKEGVVTIAAAGATATKDSRSNEYVFNRRDQVVSFVEQIASSIAVEEGVWEQ